MIERSVSRQYQIYICGEKPEEVDVLNIPMFNSSIVVGKNSKVSLWEADYLTSGYRSQAKFMDDINQIMIFKPVSIKLAPLESRYRAVIFDDPTINYVAGEIVKRRPSTYKAALVGEINRDGDKEYGKKLVDDLKKKLKDATGDYQALTIMTALYTSKITDYHLSFLMLYSYNLRTSCKYEMPNRDGLGNEGIYDEAINQYSNFREAYIFYKRFRNDYDKIRGIIGDDVIFGATIIPDAAGTGYKYRLNLQKHGEMVISSNENLLNETVSNNPLYDYEQVEKVQSNDPLDPYDAYSIPDEAYEILEEDQHDNNEVVDNTAQKKSEAIKEELIKQASKMYRNTMRKKAVEAVNHEDPLDSYAIPDEEYEKAEEAYREHVQTYMMTNN